MTVTSVGEDVEERKPWYTAVEEVGSKKYGQVESRLERIAYWVSLGKATS